MVPMSRVAVLPTRDAVLLPGAVNELQVGRPGSVAALRYAAEREEPVLVLLQREAAVDEPGPDDMHLVGTMCRVTDAERMSAEAACIGVMGLERVRVVMIERSGDALFAEVEPFAWRPVEPEVPEPLKGTLPFLIDSALRSLFSARTFGGVNAGSLTGQLCVMSVVAALSPAQLQVVLESGDLVPVVVALASLRDESWLARLLRWISR